MKRNIISAFLLACLAVSGTKAAEPIFSNSELTATVIEPGVTVLETADKTTLYLVEGDTAALLIDTGTRISSLDSIAEALTSKPLSVVLTHGHYDHAGNIGCFPRIFMHPADTVLNTPSLKEYTGSIIPVSDGDRFELGARTLEVLHTPGHTPGSITLVDYDRHMAFTGDAFGSGQLWMQLDPQVSFDILAESCGRMIELMDGRDIGKLYVGHYPYLKRPLGMDYMTDVALAARDIDSGNTTAAQPFGNDAMILRHGTAEIVYRPQIAGRHTIPSKRMLLKLDDVHYGEENNAVPPRWNRLVDYLASNRIKANLGIIGYSLDSDRSDYFEWLRRVGSLGNIEFWNHGFHNRTSVDEQGEFEQDFDTQRRALHLTDSLCTAKTGIRLHAWGPHWTDCNMHTDSALASVPDIRLVFGHRTLPVHKHYKGAVLPPTLCMEYPVHNPAYKDFLINYLGRWRNLDTFFLQGHPNSWDNSRWTEFRQIIERLQADGVRFMTISEYISDHSHHNI